MARRDYPGVYPYDREGQTLYRALFRNSAGRQRQRRGFTSPSAAAKYRSEMMVRADRGELRATRQRFGDWFDEWLRGHHAVSAGTRADYRRHGEKRLKPFFGHARLSAITVRLVKDFVAEQIEHVEAGDLAPETVNNSLACLSTIDANKAGKISRRDGPGGA